LRRIFGREIDMLDAPVMPGEYTSETEALPDIPYEAAGFAGEQRTAHWIAVGSEGATQTALPPELDSAMHDPQAACAIVYALLLGEGKERDAQLELLKLHVPRQAALAPSLADTISRLPKSARLPLLDLSMPALKQLPEAERMMLLDTAGQLIAADNKLTLAEFVLQTVLSRRLDKHAGRATPVRYADLSGLRDDCAVLLSLVAHVAASSSGMAAPDLFERGAGWCPEAGVASAGLIKVSAIDYARVSSALDRAHQVAPLKKPILIKMLLAAAGDAEPMPLVTADLLRAICAALEVPAPPAVAATYTTCHW
jgi:hypothetical protein